MQSVTYYINTIMTTELHRKKEWCMCQACHFVSKCLPLQSNTEKQSGHYALFSAMFCSIHSVVDEEQYEEVFLQSIVLLRNVGVLL